MNEIKAQIYSQFARIGKVISSPGRLELLDLLTQGEKTVETLCEQSQLGAKNTSAQLKELKAANLVTTKKDGKYVYYRIADELVLSFYLSLRNLAEKQLAELQKISAEYLKKPEDLSSIDRKSLLLKVKKGEIILIDVRPANEYQFGHLPHARSVPLSELKAKMKKFPKNKTIVAYCRGPYCFWAMDAVDILRKKGFKATRFEEGVVEWKTAGLPIESGVGDSA